MAKTQRQKIVNLEQRVESSPSTSSRRSNVIELNEWRQRKEKERELKPASYQDDESRYCTPARTAESTECWPSETYCLDIDMERPKPYTAKDIKAIIGHEPQVSKYHLTCPDNRTGTMSLVYTIPELKVRVQVNISGVDLTDAVPKRGVETIAGSLYTFFDKVFKITEKQPSKDFKRL